MKVSWPMFDNEQISTFVTRLQSRLEEKKEKSLKYYLLLLLLVVLHFLTTACRRLLHDCGINFVGTHTHARMGGYISNGGGISREQRILFE